MEKRKTNLSLFYTSFACLILIGFVSCKYFIKNGNKEEKECCNSCFVAYDISNEIMCQGDTIDRQANFKIPPFPIPFDPDKKNDTSRITPRIDKFGRIYDSLTAVVFGPPDSITNVLADLGYTVDEYDQCPCQDSLFFVRALYKDLIKTGRLNPEGDPGSNTGGGGSVRSRDTGIVLKTYLSFEAPDSCYEMKSMSYRTSKNKLIVAVLDAGIHNSDAYLKSYFQSLPPELRSNTNIVETNNPNKPYSPNNHGSQVAMVLNASLNHLQINSGVTILPILTHYETGYTNIYNVLCGMYTARKKAIQNRSGLIMNCSFSFYSCAQDNYDGFPIYKDVVDQFTREGITIVSSLGNNQLNLSITNAYPSQFPGVIGVASVKDQNLNENNPLSDFSNYHPEFQFYGAIGEGPFGLGCGIRGSSFSAPQVSGYFAAQKLSGLTLSNYQIFQTDMTHFKCNNKSPNENCPIFYIELK